MTFYKNASFFRHSTMNTNPNAIVQYVRSAISGVPTGVVVATVVHDPENATRKFARVGWAKVNFEKGDKFDRSRGLQIAFGRAIKGTTSTVPWSVGETYNSVVARSKNYFKGLEVVVNPVEQAPV